MARRTFIRLQLRKSSCDRWYFLVHIFKITKFESISSNGSRDIAKSLKTSFGSNFVSLRAFGSKRFSFSVQFLTFAHGRTDRHFRKSFLFSSWSRIYIHVYTYLDYFSNFYIEIGMKTTTWQTNGKTFRQMAPLEDYFSNFTPYDIFLLVFHIGNRYAYNYNNWYPPWFTGTGIFQIGPIHKICDSGGYKSLIKDVCF